MPGQLCVKNILVHIGIVHVTIVLFRTFSNITVQYKIGGALCRHLNLRAPLSWRARRESREIAVT